MERYSAQPVFSLPVRRKSRLVVLDMSTAGRFPAFLPSWEEGKVMNVVQVIAHGQGSVVRIPPDLLLPGMPPPATPADLLNFTLTLVDEHNVKLITELPFMSIAQPANAANVVRAKFFDRLPVSLERSYVQNNSGVKPTVVLEFVYE